MEILDRIDFDPGAGEIARRLRVAGLGEVERELGPMLADARRVARPRACWDVFDVRTEGERTAAVGGARFDSRVLAVNLEPCDRAALYVATCGRELESWARGYSDPLARWMADEICEEALRTAARALESQLDTLLEGRHMISMNPGSLEDWPLVQQAELFRALGDVGGAIGVELTESSLMVPRKSLSGVRYGSGEPFSNCLLCPRPDCPGRRMAYDSAAMQGRYAGALHGTLYGEPGGCLHGE